MQLLSFQSPDFLILGFLLATVLFYSLSFSSRHSARLLVSLYIARAGLEMTGIGKALLRDLEPRPYFIVQAFFAVLATFLIYWILKEVFPTSSGRKLNWFWATVLNLAILGLFIQTILSKWTAEVFALAPLTEKIFLSPSAGIVWFFAPLALLSFSRLKKKLF